MDELKLLRKYAKDPLSLKAVYNHCKKVKEVALKISKDISGVDKKFVGEAALLHDIGRLITGPGGGNAGIRHGVIGGQLLKKEGFDKRFVRVCETHVGAGITKEDIIEQGLPLPKRNFMPKTKEEKIICDADSLVFGKMEGTIDMVVKRYTREVNAKIGKRALDLHNEIMSWKKK